LKSIYAASAFALALILSFQIIQASAASISVLPSTLPTSRTETSAIWDGNNAYIFGGYTYSNDLNEIVRFNPITWIVTILPSTLPSSRTETSAIWDGNNAYIFGGKFGSTYLDEIIQFNPSTGTVTKFTSILPYEIAQTSAIWDGNNAYIFGGWGRPSGSYLRLYDDIVRFTPSNGTVKVVAYLPSPRAETSAIWDGNNAYIFGGWDGTSSLDEIIRFDPSTGTVTKLSLSALPSPRIRTSAIWDGSNAYIFGGMQGSTRINQIVRFDPSDGSVTVVAYLPTGRMETSAIWDGNNAYIFGGRYYAFLDEIVKFNPATGSVNILPCTKLPSVRFDTSAIWDGSNAYIFGGYTYSNDLNEIVRFGPDTFTITVTSDPQGSNFVKVDDNPITTPGMFTWTVGSSHKLEALSPVDGGSGIFYIWQSWSDAGDQNHIYTVLASDETITADYKLVNVRLTIEHPEIKDRTLSMTACNIFTIDFCINNIPDGYYLDVFDLQVDWDPDLMELELVREYDTERGFDGDGVEGIGSYKYRAEITGPPNWTVDAIWLSLTFHCLGEGSSPLSVSSPSGDTIWLWDGQNSIPIYTESYEIVCNQYSGIISPKSSVVGGYYVPTNMLSVMMFYLMSAAILGTLSIVYILRRKRKP